MVGALSFLPGARAGQTLPDYVRQDTCLFACEEWHSSERGNWVDLSTQLFHTWPMLERVRSAAVLLLLLAILVLTILPAFDLDPAHLRASRNAVSLLVIMALTATRAAMTISLQCASVAISSRRPSVQDLLTLTCTRLC